MRTSFRFNRRQLVGSVFAAGALGALGKTALAQTKSSLAQGGKFVGVGPATRDYRTKLMRDLMDRERLDALAFTSNAYIKFAMNFNTDVLFFERPTLCVIPRNGAPFAV